MLATPAVGSVLTSRIDDGTVPGAIAAVAHGDDVRVDVLGTTGPGGVPLRRDTIVRIASVTKPIVAAAAMTLVEDGVLDLDDRVDRWLPELADRRVLRHEGADLGGTVPARRPITVEDLLSFRLGIGVLHEFPARHPIQRAYADAALGGDGPPGSCVPPEPDEWMRRLAALPLIAQPGERWLYHTGADVLGVLLARATGSARCSRRLRTAASPWSTRSAARGPRRPRSSPEVAVWCPRWTTCWRSPGCCATAAATSSPRARSPR